MSNIIIEMRNWDDIKWYMNEGFHISEMAGVEFPGYITLQVDLSEPVQNESIRNLVLHAREKGVDIKTDDPNALEMLKLPPDTPKEENANTSEGAPKNLANRPNIERQEQLKKCNAFFLKVAEKLKDTHIIASASHRWISACLIPKGTEEQLTYHSKPVNSLRVACNWNWRASSKRCKDEKYIQCHTDDLPWARKKEADGSASKPIWGNMVGYFDADQKYHCVYGEKFNRETKTWEWVEGDPDAVAEMMRSKMSEVLATDE